MSSTPTTPTQSSSSLAKNIDTKGDRNTPSRASSSSSTSEEGPDTPPTHPNSPYAANRAYPRLHTTPFTADPLDPASRRDSSSALRASVLNVFADLGAFDSNQYADWMFGDLPDWEEGQSLRRPRPHPTRAELGAGVRFQTGSRFRERLDSVGSSLALLDGYMKLSKRELEQELSEEEEEERPRGASRFWRPRSKSRTRSKSRQKEKSKKEPPPSGTTNRDVKRKSVWRKSLRASGYESDGAAVTEANSSLRGTYTKSKPSIRRSPSQTRKEDISGPVRLSHAVTTDDLDVSVVTTRTSSTDLETSRSSSNGTPTPYIPSYTASFPLAAPAALGSGLTRSISHDDINPRTNRHSVGTLNTLVLEESWDKVDPLTTVDFKTLESFENPFVGSGKLRKPPKQKKTKGKNRKDAYASSSALPSTVASQFVDLPPVPIVPTSAIQNSTNGSKKHRNIPKVIELPVDNGNGVPFPYSPGHSTLPHSAASDTTPIYTNSTHTPSRLSAESAEVPSPGASGGGDGQGGLFSRLARPFLTSQTSSKRSYKPSKASSTASAAHEANMHTNGNGSRVATPKVSTSPSTPRTPRTPQSPFSKAGSGAGVERMSEDSTDRPGTPLSPLSRALEGGQVERASFDDYAYDHSQGSPRRVPQPKMPMTPGSVQFPRVSSDSGEIRSIPGEEEY